MVSVQAVSASYGSTQVLDGISFDLDAGEICTVLGVSGCGKSTLLSVMAGLKKPDSGMVTLGGEPILPGDGKTGLILQNYGLFPWFTALQNAALGLRIRGVSKQKREHTAYMELERVGLSGFENRYPESLSGGQRQRIAFARTMAMRPSLLLMDEPFSSLDALTRENLQDLMLAVLTEERLATVLVTHSIEEAVYLGTRILVLSVKPAKIAAVFENCDVRNPAYRKSTEFFSGCARVRAALDGSGSVNS